MRPCFSGTASAEKVLLERLRYYEGLLRRNNIPFEPLHSGSTAGEQMSAGENERRFTSLRDARSEERECKRSEVVCEDTFYWHD